MKNLTRTFFLIVFCFALLMACSEEETLPIYGKFPVETENGIDTVIRTISDFEFINQDSAIVTQQTFEDKIYVTDFFFTSCPAICPAMKRQMMRVHEAYLENETVLLLSHTIDPVRDTIPKMKDYSVKLGIENADKWHFVTGEKEDLYGMAKEYMIAAYEDENVQGGFDHSGLFLLIDKDRQIRGFYEGTEEEEVDLLIEDMAVLLKEYE